MLDTPSSEALSCPPTMSDRQARVRRFFRIPLLLLCNAFSKGSGFGSANCGKTRVTTLQRKFLAPSRRLPDIPDKPGDCCVVHDDFRDRNSGHCPDRLRGGRGPAGIVGRDRGLQHFLPRISHFARAAVGLSCRDGLMRAEIRS